MQKRQVKILDSEIDSLRLEKTILTDHFGSETVTTVLKERLGENYIVLPNASNDVNVISLP